MCTDVALLKKRRCIMFDERKWLNVKVYFNDNTLFIMNRNTNTRKREIQ